MDKSHQGLTPQTKTRFWVGVLWMENIDQEALSDLEGTLQGLPYAYCIHDKDYENGDPQEPRKPHMHMIIGFSNTTTYNHALRVFRGLGEKAINTCEPVIRIRYKYDYLIHNTKTCEEIRQKDRLAGKHETKHLYDVNERICGNGFDIGIFEQLSTLEKQRLLKEMDQFMIDNQIYDYSMAAQLFGSMEDAIKYELFIGHSAHFERMCKGIYLRDMRLGK